MYRSKIESKKLKLEQKFKKLYIDVYFGHRLAISNLVVKIVICVMALQNKCLHVQNMWVDLSKWSFSCADYLIYIEHYIISSFAYDFWNLGI